jgi:SpoVK/Ycf46/Vps4 family AAA+-type ATPase
MDYKYILPNKIGFIDFKQNEYHHDKIDKYTEEYNKKYKQQIYMHQMLINKYMNINTPYRGLLLYHELGTGKTMTSIGILNQYLLNNKKIFVLLPASLRNNFIKELFVRSYFKKYSNNNTLWTKIEYNNNLNEIKTFFNEYTIKL